jgi:O-antigen/teichoic acid export membrane protein
MLSDERCADTHPEGAARSLSLRANFCWTFASNIFYAACQWGMLVVLARLGNPEMIGQFTLGLAVTTPIISLGNLQLRDIQVTDAKNEYRFGDYLGLRLMTVVLGLLATIAITVVSGYHSTLAAVVLVVGGAKAFEAVSDIFYGLLQQHERMDRIAMSVMIRGFLSLFAFSVTIYLSYSILWGAVSLAVVWGTILMSYDLRSGVLISRVLTVGNGTPTSLRPRWAWRTLSRLAWRAVPVGLVAMLVSLKSSLPSYFIAHYLGGYELGIFAAIAYIERAEVIVVSALGWAAVPRLSKYYVAGNGSAFRLLLLKMVVAGMLVGIGGVLVALVAGREVLTLLYRAEYARSDVFVWLMVAVGITNVGWCLFYGMTAARYFRVQLPLFMLVTTTTAVACVWFIPAEGLRGATMALLMAAVIQTVGALAVIVYALSAPLGGQQEGEQRGRR